MRPAGHRRPPRPHPRRREVTSTSRHTQRRRLLSRSLSRPRRQHAAEPRPGPSTPRPKSPRGHAQAARPGHPHTHAPNAPEITAHAARPGRNNGTRHLPTAVSLSDGCRSRSQQLIDVSQLSVTHSGPHTATAATLSPRVPLYAPTALAHNALPRPGGGAVRRRGGRRAPCYGYEQYLGGGTSTSTSAFPCSERRPQSSPLRATAESLVRLSRPAAAGEVLGGVRQRTMAGCVAIRGPRIVTAPLAGQGYHAPACRVGQRCPYNVSCTRVQGTSSSSSSCTSKGSWAAEG